MLETLDWKLVIEIVLFVLGFVLVGVEMYMPGLEGPGILGVISLVAGIFITADTIPEGVLITLVVLIVLIVMFIIIVKYLSRGRENSKVVLKDELKTEAGYTSSSVYDNLVGKKGIAVTDLRPSGTGKFGDLEYDVVTEGKYITKATKIEVFKVEGVRIVVREDK